MTDPRPRTQNKTQFVYDYVMEGIVDGTFPGGSSLGIAALAEETGVSLIPTREALRRLESEGLVEFLFHRGVRVSELTTEKYREIMQTEAVLEGLAVGLSVPLLKREDLIYAQTVNEQMNVAINAGDFHEYNRRSLEFHGILRGPCPNTHLREMLDRGQQRVAAVRASVIGYRGSIAARLSDEHEHMVNRILAGAPADEIERLMRAHREGTIAADSEGLRRSTSETRSVGAEPH